MRIKEKVSQEEAKREKRLQNESQHLKDSFLDQMPDVDSKLLEEQRRVLQQAVFRKREKDIRRAREEWKRNESIGNDLNRTRPNSSYLSNWPGTSPSMSKLPPQYNDPSISERSPGLSTGGWGAGAPHLERWT